MNLEEIKALFDQLSYLKVVKITGGEPFLRRDLPDILDYFLNERKLMVQVTSNGLLTDQIARAVRDLASPRLHMCISLDGVGEFVNEMRGIRNYYEIVLNTLKELIKVRKEKNFSLSVNQTLFHHDTSQIVTLRPVLTGIGIESIHYTMEHNLFDHEVSEDDKKNYWRDVPKDNFLRVKEAVNKLTLKNEMRDIAYRYYFKGLENRVLLGRKRPKFRCTALSSYFRLNPNGEIITCSVMTKPVAKICHAEFIKVWQSQKMNEARNIVKNCEGCWFGCEVIPNATISGGIVKGMFY